MNQNGLLDENGTPMTPERQSLENTKQSVTTIEFFFHAMKEVEVPLKYAEAVLNGMAFFNRMHAQLVAQIPPDEIDKMRKEATNGKT